MDAGFVNLARQIARLLSAANTTNATLVKGAQGVVNRIRLHNAGTITYLKLYDKATAPTVGTDAPVATYYLAASTDYDIVVDKQFFSGIGYALTTAAADSDTGAVASGAVLCMNITYS